MAEKLPPGHGADAHKDKMGKVMHEFKRGQLRSGTGKKGKKGKVVTDRAQAVAIGSSYAEKLMAMGYTEEAAMEVASFVVFNEPLGLAMASGMVQTAAGYIESEEAAKLTEQNSYEGDVDHTPGKQKPQKDRVAKQDDQDSIATFPTVPHSEGPMVRASKGRCPTGTRSVGGGFCKNPKAGKRQYFEIERGKSCPPGSKGAGKGRCRVDFSEFADGGVAAIDNTPCPEKKSPAEKQAEKAERGTQPTQPTSPQGNTSEPVKPLAGEDLEKRRVAKERAERCAKERGN
jgi:Fe2+ transport system protein FeoA